MKKLIALTVLVLATAGCAHHRDVRPGADGVHRVTIQTDDTEAASRDAIAQANNYCEEKKKEAVFLNEAKVYTGDLDESTYRNAKRATTVAKTVGGTVAVFGGKRERNVGGIAGVGGVAGDQALGNGYTVEMRFKCQ